MLVFNLLTKVKTDCSCPGGEETDLGTARTLTLLLYVPRNTVGGGEGGLVLLLCVITTHYH